MKRKSWSVVGGSFTSCIAPKPLFQSHVERNIGSAADRRIKARPRHAESVAVDLPIRTIARIRRVTADGSVQLFGLGNAVNRQITVHLERGRSARNDPRARIGSSAG